MRFCFSFFLAVGILLLPDTCSPKAQQITFNRVFAPDGPYFRMINGVTQDTLGYMWFSSFSMGLSRYDGYHVTVFRNDPRDPGSLASNGVSCVLADHNGIIWVGTVNSGLDRFDPRTGFFTHFRHKKGEPSSLSDDVVHTILADHNGTLWIGTENGLNRMDMKTGTFTRYQQNPTDATTLSCNSVQVLYEDHRGTLWVGTGSPQHFYSSNERGGLNRLDRKTGKFTRYLHDSNDPHSLSSDRIGALFEDSRGVFWVSTAGDGLHTMDREKGTFERYPYDPAHPERLSGPPPQDDVGLDLNNFFVTEDRSGAIWIASSKRWVTRYDPKIKKAHHFDSFNGDAQAVQSLTEVYSSREGVLWFATWRGSIYRVDPLEVTIPHVFTGSGVHAVHEDVSGKLWLGTDGAGLIEADRKTGSLKQFCTDLTDPYGLSDAVITAIYGGDDSTLWISSAKDMMSKEGCLNQYDKKKRIFTRYVNDPKSKSSLTKAFVTAIAKDKPGSLWVATKEGLDRFDIKRGIFTHYRNEPNDSTSIGGNHVSALLKDHSGNLWAGNWNGTLNLFDSQTGKFKRFPCSLGINNITQDAENIIWLGTANGLYKSNPVLDTFLLVTDPEIGLTGTTIIAYILEDDKKNLWVSSSAGILKFSPDRNDITVYSRSQGVDVSALTRTWGHNMQGVKGKRGELFFGDRTGYYAFFPDQLKVNVTPPQIVIADFRLADNQPVKPGESSPIKIPIMYTKEIHLEYDQNVFSFDFIGIHYSSPENIRMLFFMENLDNTWRKASLEKKAFYYNVPPGHYVFRIKAANIDGIWAEKAITIIVHPPWWRTWWAYTLFSILFLAMLRSFIKWRENVLKKEKALLEEKVAVRTHELQVEKERVERTLTVLKETQEQLIQFEKMASMSKLQQAMLRERLRISRELHDDIGSTLSGIVLYSHLAGIQIQAQDINEVEKSLFKIQQSANEMVSRLSDIVWAVNPEHNTVKNLMHKLEEYAEEIASAKSIKVKMNLQAQLTEIRLPAENCHNIYLLGKEAINNAVKYSNASFIELSADCFDHIIEFKFKDDGKGFSVETMKKGNGLINMRKRADDIGAAFSLETCPGKGTRILLQCKIT